MLYCHLWPLSDCTIFSSLSRKQYDFWENFTVHRMCVLISSATLVWNISHSKNYSARYCHKFTKVYETRAFSHMFSYNTKVLYFMKILPVGEPSCTMLTDVRTDVTKLIVAFGNFAKGPKNEWDIRHWVYPGSSIHVISYLEIDKFTFAQVNCWNYFNLTFRIVMPVIIRRALKDSL